MFVRFSGIAAGFTNVGVKSVTSDRIGARNPHPPVILWGKILYESVPIPRPLTVSRQRKCLILSHPHFEEPD
ncbi:hypothetical protein TPY_2323 [Sulfobacillus acidophilus TPY]|nr:hypothetical protein TPY_2323 [Sulfobacillus acidophilus TPY]